MNYWKRKELERWAELTGMDKHPLVKRFLSSPLLQARPEWEEKITRFLQTRMSVMVPEPHPFLPGPKQGTEAETGPWVSPGRVIGGNGPGELFRDPLASFLQHKGFFGPAGSGKTMLSFLMTVQAHRRGVPVWWFDSEDEISPLLAREEGVLFVELGDLKFNPFTPPPGCDAVHYMEKVTSRFREALYFRDGSVNLTRNVCRALMDQQGPFSLGDVYRSLLRMIFKVGQRQAGYWESCCNRFVELLSALGKTIDVRQGHDLGRLLGRSVVWRLRGLSDDHLAFIIGCLLLWVENRRSAQYEWRLDNIFVFDEVSRFCNISRERRADIGEPFFYDFVRTCRKRAIGVVVATQTPGLLPIPVIANLSTWYTFKPVDAVSGNVVRVSMGLEQEQMDYLKALPEDMGRVVAVRHANHPRPFLVQVEHWPVEPAQPELVRQRVEESREWLGPVPVAEVEEPEHGRETQEAGAEPLAGTAGRQAGKGSGPMHPFEVSKADLDYLQRIAERPFVPVTKRDKQEGLTGYMGDKLRKELADLGLVRFHKINTGGQGGRITLAEPTELAYRLLEALQVKVERPKGNGGFVHQYWQDAIHRWAMGKGYPARIEGALGQKRVDVAVEWAEKRCAVEVVVEGIEKELTNLEKDLQEGWDQVVFCAEKEETLKKLKQMIGTEGGESLIKEGRVAFMRFKEFIA